MAGQFYWAWQIAAKPSLVTGKLKTDDAQLQPSKRLRYFNSMLQAILSLMGYIRTKDEEYEHHLLKGKLCVVSSKLVTMHCGKTEYYCTVTSDGSAATMLAVEVEADPVVTNQTIAKWVLSIVHAVARRLPMPRPHYGCLLVQGEDFGSTRLTAQHLYDYSLLRGQPDTTNAPPLLYIEQPLKKFASTKNQHELFTFARTDQRGNVVEYTVVRNQDKDTILAVIRLFFALGYVSPVCLFSGFGTEHIGELVVRATGTAIAGQKTFSTISYGELSSAVDAYDPYPRGFCAELKRVSPPAHLGSTLVILNSSYAHLFAPAGAQHSPRSSPGRAVPPCDLTTDGKCVHKVLALSTAESPLAPSTGALRYLRNQPHLLPEHYDVALPLVRAASATFPKMHTFAVDLIRALYPFKFSAKSVLVVPDTHTAVKSGVYAFHCGAGGGTGTGASAVHVVYEALTRHALVVDSGSDAERFYRDVWMGFVMAFVDTYDAVITRPTSDCTSGFVALLASRSFLKRQQTPSSRLPRCGKLYCAMPISPKGRAPAVGNHMGLYADLGLIVTLARKAGVTVFTSITDEAALYSSTQRSLHAMFQIQVQALVSEAGAGTSRAAHDTTRSASHSGLIDGLSPIRAKVPLLVSTREESCQTRVEAETHVAVLVRAWTKVAKVTEVRSVQYLLDSSLPVQFPSPALAQRGGVAVPWDRFMPFPPEY